MKRIRLYKIDKWWTLYVNIFGLEIETNNHSKVKQLFITNKGPIFKRSFMLWIRYWPIYWGPHPKHIVLWRKRGSS